MESDCVLGHEAAGIVLRLGEGVTDLVVGEFCNLSFHFCLSIFLYGEGVFEKCYVVCGRDGNRKEQESVKGENRKEH